MNTKVVNYNYLKMKKHTKASGSFHQSLTCLSMFFYHVTLIIFFCDISKIVIPPQERLNKSIGFLVSYSALRL